MGPSLRATRALVLLLMTTALAGCASPEESDEDVGAEEMTLADALALFTRAFGAVGGDAPPTGDEAVTRYSVAGDVEAFEEGGTSEGEFDVLLDTENAVSLITMSGELFQNGTTSPLATGADAIVFAAVWQTSFLGSPDGLLAVYNESAEPATSLRDLAEQGTMGASDGSSANEGLTDPFSILAAMGKLPEDAVVTHDVIEHEGEPAVEITASHEASGLVTLKAIVWIESELPATVDATYRDEEADDPVSRNGHFALRYAYGDDAEHELEGGVVRLETLTLLNMTSGGAAVDFGDPSSGEPGTKDYAVQPSHAPGTIPLDEVTAMVWSAAGGGPGLTEPELELPLEEGTAATDELSLTFTDVDGDGHVSPGDTLVLTVASGDASNYTAGLMDEETGITALPGFAAWMALVALGGALVLTRRGAL